MRPRPAVIAVAGAGALLVLVLLVALGLTDGVDAALIDVVRRSELSGSLGFLRPITELGSTGAVTAVGAVVFAIGVAVGPWLHGLAGTLTIGLTSIAVELAKAVVARARPDLLEPIVSERGFSFPSGHATLSMAAYGILAVLVMRSRLRRAAKGIVAAAAAIVILLVGVSRVWLGVHYPTDVVAGWLTGGIVVATFAALTRRVSTEPASVAVDADRGARRSDPPAAG